MRAPSAQDRVRELILRLAATVDADVSLPSYDELAERADCSVGPVKAAMRSLERAGVVSLRRGRRAKVLAGERHRRLPSLSRTMERRGGTLVNRVLEAAHRLAHADEQQYWRLLELEPETPALVCRRLRVIDGEPHIIHHAYIRPDIVGGPGFFEVHDIARESLTAIYERLGVEVLRVPALLRAGIADDTERSLLRLPEGAPVLRNLQQAIVRRGIWRGTLEVVLATYTDHITLNCDRPLDSAARN